MRRQQKGPTPADHLLVLREEVRSLQQERAKMFGPYTAAKRDSRDPRAQEKIEAFERQGLRLQALSWAVDVLTGKVPSPGRTLLRNLITAVRGVEVKGPARELEAVVGAVVAGEKFLGLPGPERPTTPRAPPSSSTPAPTTTPGYVTTEALVASGNPPLADDEALCELVEDFSDGELPPAQADAFRAHAADCPACQNELRQLAQLRALALEAAAKKEGPGELLKCTGCGQTAPTAIMSEGMRHLVPDPKAEGTEAAPLTCGEFRRADAGSIEEAVSGASDVRE